MKPEVGKRNSYLKRVSACRIRSRSFLLFKFQVSFFILLLSSFNLVPAFAGTNDYPSWWITRGVVNTNAASTNDWAAINHGQLKWVATNAYDELNANLPNGAGTNVSNIVVSFTTSNNFQAVNLGQLKNVAAPFYDRLIAEVYTNAYPWTGAASTNDFAMANIGQVKRLFSFDLSASWDTDGDNLADWWEISNFSSIEAYSGVDDPDGDGFLNCYEYRYAKNPLNAASYPSPTLYVGGTGASDTNSGLSAASAKATIQAAIDASSQKYDIIQVADGVYSNTGNRDIDLQAKSIMLRSAGGASNCVISCDGTVSNFHRAFVFSGYATPTTVADAVIDGFTMTGGYHTNGGAVCGEANSIVAAIQNCIITNCNAHQNGSGAGNGGAIYFSDVAYETVVIRNCQIMNNLADYDGGGVYIDTASSFTIDSCSIKSNEARGAAGSGIFVDSANGLITNTVISLNGGYYSETDEGGGINIRGDSQRSVAIRNCSINENRCVGAYPTVQGGGGISALMFYGELTINDTTFSNNLSLYGPGGGILAGSGAARLYVHDSLLIENKGKQGGGIYAKNCAQSSSQDLEIHGCQFINDKATEGGGAIASVNSGGSIEACRFYSNAATNYGGAVSCITTSKLNIQNCFFASNISVRGGAIASSNSAPRIMNSTIMTNTASVLGGAVVSWGALSPGITNSIIWNNATNELYSYSNAITASYCDIFGGYSGTGNIATNPLLRKEGLHIASTNSPCWNAGTTNAAPASDVDGDSRPNGGGIDIGCDELADTDGDGIPDWWEQEYFGGVTNGTADGDLDGDGMNNISEFNAYSSPSDPDYSWWVWDVVPSCYDAVPGWPDFVTASLTFSRKANEMLFLSSSATNLESLAVDDDIWVRVDGGTWTNVVSFDESKTVDITALTGVGSNVLDFKATDTSSPPSFAVSAMYLVKMKVDIEQVETNVSWTATNATLNLTSDSFWAPGWTGDVAWTSSPAGLYPSSGSGSTFSFNPNSSTPTTYVVTARSTLFTNCYDTCTVRVLKVDINGDYNRDGNPVDNAGETNAITFAGPKGFVVLANYDDDDGDLYPDAADDAINGANDLADIAEFKVACLGIPATDIPSTFAAEFKVLDPTNGTLTNTVRIFLQRTETQEGGAQIVMSNAILKTCLGGVGFWTMGIEGCAYGKEAIVRMTLKDGTTEIGSDEYRVMIAPYFVSPNNRNADEVFVSFTDNASAYQAFTNGLSGIAPIRKSSDYPIGTGSSSMRYIQDHVEFGYTRTAPSQTIFKAMQVILGMSSTDPSLQDLLTNNRAFYAEIEDNNFGDLMITPETSSHPYGTIVCGTEFVYKDFLKRQNVQPVGSGIVELDDTWLKTPHVDNLVAFIPYGSSFKVLVADLQLATNILCTYSNTSVEVFDDPRPIYTNSAYAEGITNIQTKLNTMYDALETGLGISKTNFIHVPVTFDPTVSNSVRTFLPDMVNMQYVKSSSGERVLLPKAYFEPFYTDSTNGLKTVLNNIGITDGEIQVVPTGSGGYSPFHDGDGGDVHCISNPSMEAPASP